MLSKEEIYTKIEQLKKDLIGYLEIDDKAGARRKEKQIEKLEMQLRLYETENIEKELRIYKEVVKNYPTLQNEIQRRLKKC